MKGTYETQDQY